MAALLVWIGMMWIVEAARVAKPVLCSTDINNNYCNAETTLNDVFYNRVGAGQGVIARLAQVAQDNPNFGCLLPPDTRVRVTTQPTNVVTLGSSQQVEFQVVNVGLFTPTEERAAQEYSIRRCARGSYTARYIKVNMDMVNWLPGYCGATGREATTLLVSCPAQCDTSVYGKCNSSPSVSLAECTCTCKTGQFGRSCQDTCQPPCDASGTCILPSGAIRPQCICPAGRAGNTCSLDTTSLVDSSSVCSNRGYLVSSV